MTAYEGWGTAMGTKGNHFYLGRTKSGVPFLLKQVFALFSIVPHILLIFVSYAIIHRVPGLTWSLLIMLEGKYDQQSILHKREPKAQKAYVTLPRWYSQ